MSKPTYYGVIINFTTVEQYRRNPDFSSFVFQPVIADFSNKSHEYTLTVYAMLSSSPPQLVPTNPYMLKPFEVKHKNKVQFANIILDRATLNDLYPAGSDSELRIYATGYYNSTDYVTYVAETDNKQELTLITKVINPSPPV